MNNSLQVILSYKGAVADAGQIDLYDVARGLMGFQRSLALTTHMVLNDEVITQAPSLYGAQILAFPSEEGSWKLKVAVAIGTTALTAAVAPKDSLLGHLVYSAYDYVISESLGTHVDYSKSLGEQYERLKKSRAAIPILEQHRLDSVVEKCTTAIEEIHRPIISQRTATTAIISVLVNKQSYRVGPPLTAETYEYIAVTNIDNAPDIVVGAVSSYNSNTYKGRIYVRSEGRTIPFELLKSARNLASASLLANSLAINVQSSGHNEKAFVYCKAYRKTSKSGLLKGYNFIEVSAAPIAI